MISTTHTSVDDESYLRHGRTTRPDDHSDLQVLRRIKRFLLPKDFVISPALLTDMAAGYDIGDSLMDNLCVQRLPVIKPLQQMAAGHIDTHEYMALPEFAALTEQFAAHPDWFDPKLAEVGAIAYRRYPLMLIWLLRNVALMAGYSIPALSLPLIQTGALVHDALPRLMRTYAYILAVSEYPALKKQADAPLSQVLAIGSEGWRQSIQVRYIHSVVRRQLLHETPSAAALANGAAPTWDSDYWGIPINQTDMVATHLQFSLLIMRGLQLLGARISKEEAAGILHLWSLASYWLGVDIKRLPENETACWEWLYSYLSIQQLNFKMGRPLAKALHDLPSQIMGEDNRRGRFVEQVNASVTRTLVGDDIGDGLDLPKSKLRFGVLSSVPILFALDTARQRNDRVANKLERFRAQRQDNMNWWLKENDTYYQQ